MKLENVFLILGAGCLIAGIITINIAPHWLQKALLEVAIPSAIGAATITTLEESIKEKKKTAITKNKEEEE